MQIVQKKSLTIYQPRYQQWHFLFVLIAIFSKTLQKKKKSPINLYKLRLKVKMITLYVIQSIPAGVEISVPNLNGQNVVVNFRQILFALIKVFDNDAFQL